MGFAYKRIAEQFGDNPVERRDILGSFIKPGLTQKQLEGRVSHAGLSRIGHDLISFAYHTSLHIDLPPGSGPVDARGREGCGNR